MSAAMPAAAIDRGRPPAEKNAIRSMASSVLDNEW